MRTDQRKRIPTKSELCIYLASLSQLTGKQRWFSGEIKSEKPHSHGLKWNGGEDSDQECKLGDELKGTCKPLHLTQSQNAITHPKVRDWGIPLGKKMNNFRKMHLQIVRFEGIPVKRTAPPLSPVVTVLKVFGLNTSLNSKIIEDSKELLFMQAVVIKCYHFRNFF